MKLSVDRKTENECYNWKGMDRGKSTYLFYFVSSETSAILFFAVQQTVVEWTLQVFAS